MTTLKSDLSSEFSDLCRLNGFIAVFAFGSRAEEIAARLRCGDPRSTNPDSDLDLGILPPHDADFSVQRIVRFAVTVEEIFGISRADIVDLRKAPAYLALDVIRGDRIYCADDVLTANFELFVLRRAGDLAFFERERRRMLLEPSAERRANPS